MSLRGSTTFSLTVKVLPHLQTACCTINGYPQVIVTGPGCFSFSGPITLDNTPIAIPVTDFATIANAGCYFATVVDASGCIGTNITQPGKVVVTRVHAHKYVRISRRAARKSGPFCDRHGSLSEVGTRDASSRGIELSNDFLVQVLISRSCFVYTFTKRECKKKCSLLLFFKEEPVCLSSLF